MEEQVGSAVFKETPLTAEHSQHFGDGGKYYERGLSHGRVERRF